MQLKKALKKYGAVCGITVTVVAAVVTVLLSGISETDKGTVEAAQAVELCETESSELEAGGEQQAGLRGIVRSIDHMRSYSVAASAVNITSENEQVLVGTRRVQRGALNRIAMEKDTSGLGDIGYFAQMAVRENHMASEDYYSLVQIVEAEATGGDMKSKILIADVVLNRVADDRFPDSIYQVVWDNEGGVAQFSPTEDGRIYSVEITDETYEAVDRALAGEDYSEGALFFMARASAEEYNQEWFDKNLERLFEYGGHEYYKFAE